MKIWQTRRNRSNVKVMRPIAYQMQLHRDVDNHLFIVEMCNNNVHFSKRSGCVCIPCLLHNILSNPLERKMSFPYVHKLILDGRERLAVVNLFINIAIPMRLVK